MNRWKVIFAAALIFAIGVATGALGARLLARPQNNTRTGWVPFGVLDARYNLLGKMRDQLKLSEDQAKRVDAILQDGRKRMRAAWESFHPTMREETKGVYARISAELTEAQRVQWEEMLKKSRERRGPPRMEGDKGNPSRRGEGATNAPPSGRPAAAHGPPEADARPAGAAPEAAAPARDSRP